MSDDRLHWRVEAAFRAAWPALDEIRAGDWCLRFANGVSRRANSANALAPVTGDIGGVIDWAEREYRARHLPPIFRVPALLDPALDAMLDARGYKAEGASRTLYQDLPPMPMRRDPDVTISSQADDAWFEAMGRLQGWSPERLAGYRAIVARIAAPAGFFTLRIDGTPAAMAFAVIADGIALVESVVADPARRRQGHTRRLVGALLAWAIDRGAAAAALQVEAGNSPALALYRGMGFMRDLYDYAYRVKAGSV